VASDGKLWTAWIPLTVSVAAVGFTGLQWWDSHKQLRLASEATVAFDIDMNPVPHHYGIALRNVGPGVARIRSVKFYADGLLIGDPDDVIERAKLDPERAEELEIAGDVMAPGEIDWLVDYHARGKEDEARAENFFLNHFNALVDYCSADGRCAKDCSTQGACESK